MLSTISSLISLLTKMLVPFNMAQHIKETNIPTNIPEKNEIFTLLR